MFKKSEEKYGAKYVMATLVTTKLSKRWQDTKIYNDFTMIKKKCIGWKTNGYAVAKCQKTNKVIGKESGKLTSKII